MEEAVHLGLCIGRGDDTEPRLMRSQAPQGGQVAVIIQGLRDEEEVQGGQALHLTPHPHAHGYALQLPRTINAYGFAYGFAYGGDVARQVEPKWQSSERQRLCLVWV